MLVLVDGSSEMCSPTRTLSPPLPGGTSAGGAFHLLHQRKGPEPHLSAQQQTEVALTPLPSSSRGEDWGAYNNSVSVEVGSWERMGPTRHHSPSATGLSVCQVQVPVFRTQ